MILILSSESDQSTIAVIKWLRFYGEKWIKIDFKKFMKPVRFSIHSTTEEFVICTTTGKTIKSKDISSYWYKEGDFSFVAPVDFSGVKNEKLKNNIASHIYSELEFLKTGLHYLLSKKRHINDIRLSGINNLEILSKAKQVGLLIPETLITTKKTDYLNFKKKHKKIVSKAIQKQANFSIDKDGEKRIFSSFTEMFYEKEIPSEFFPTLFQNKIDKKYDLEIFYLKKKFYSMAVFSQLDNKTKVDYRNSDPENFPWKKLNRRVPYLLPQKVKIKLILLMEDLRIDSGLIDMAVDSKNRFVFFGVKTDGQFNIISTSCNYYLDKILARQLM